MTTFRIERPRIDITRGPTMSHPGDTHRVYTQGMPAYYVDDVEVDEATYAARLTEAWEASARTAPAQRPQEVRKHSVTISNHR